MTSPTGAVRSWQPGDIIGGRFRLTGTVGRGAMGAVYAGEHVETGQRVAIKCMLVSDEAGEEFVRRFSQEARVMAGLKSPNTIRIYDFGRAADGALYMAMELLTGVPLDKHIRELQRKGESMDERAVLEVGVQILRSLGEAHHQGLVHRDMKPGNVFLTDDGSGEVLVKVLDFGIARVADSSLTNAGKVLGTPAYMSPEQWEGERIDARSDLYSVGCILYCCATGQPPYQAGENMLSLMKKHCCDPIPDAREIAKSELSDGFVHVLRMAMAKQAQNRFADARAMREALQAVLGGAWAATPEPTVATRRPSATLAAVLQGDDEATVVTGQKPRTSKMLPMDSASDPEVVAPELALANAEQQRTGKSPLRWLIVAAVAVAAGLVGAALWLEPPPAVVVQQKETVKEAAVPAPVRDRAPVRHPAPAPASVSELPSDSRRSQGSAFPAPAPAPAPAAAPTGPLAQPTANAAKPTVKEAVARGLVLRRTDVDAKPGKSKPTPAPQPKHAKKEGDHGVQIRAID